MCDVGLALARRLCSRTPAPLLVSPSLLGLVLCSFVIASSGSDCKSDILSASDLKNREGAWSWSWQAVSVVIGSYSDSHLTYTRPAHEGPTHPARFFLRAHSACNRASFTVPDESWWCGAG